MTTPKHRGLRLITLRGCNVYTYKEEFELPLDNQGLVFVSGKNLDTEVPSSSGAGKSRLFSLIARALYGRETLDKEPVSAIWSADGSPGYYELVYWADGTFYKVREESGSKSAKLSFFSSSDLNGTWDPIGARNKKDGLQREIAASVARPLNEFLGTVVWRQGHGHVLIQGTPSERIAWLSGLFGLTKYDMIFDELTAKLDDNKTKQQEYLPFVGAYTQAKAAFSSMGDRATLVSFLDSSAGRMTEIQERMRLARIEQSEAGALLVEAEASVSNVASLSKLNATVTEVQNSGANLISINTELSALQDQRSVLADKLNKVMYARPIIDAWSLVPQDLQLLAQDDAALSKLQVDLTDARVRAVALRGQLQEHEDIRAARTNLSSRLRSLFESLSPLGFNLTTVDSTTVHITDTANRLQQLRDEVAVLKNTIQSFSKIAQLGGSCPVCGNAVDSNHAAQEIQLAQGRLSSPKGPSAEIEYLDKVHAGLTSYASLLTQYSNAPTVSDTDTASVQHELDGITAKGTELASRLDSVSRVSVSYKAYLGLDPSVVHADLTEIQSNLASLDKKLTELRAAAGRAQSLIPLLGKPMDKTQDDVIRIKELVSHCMQRVDSIQAEQSSLQSEIAVTSHKLTQLDLAATELDRLGTLYAKYEQLSKTGSLISSIRKAYDKKGFKQQKLRHLLELIKVKLPVWTSLLFTEQNTTVDVVSEETKLSLVVRQFSDPTGTGKLVEKVYDVSEMSGGEQSKLAICIMLTLIDIVADERKCNIAILDEVDRHMDKNALRLMSEHLIRNLAARRSSIYLVSHQIPLSSDFDKELVVTKHRACSTIELKKLHSV